LLLHRQFAKEKLPEKVWEDPAFKTGNTAITFIWALALFVMTLSSGAALLLLSQLRLPPTPSVSIVPSGPHTLRIHCPACPSTPGVLLTQHLSRAAIEPTMKQAGYDSPMWITIVFGWIGQIGPMVLAVRLTVDYINGKTA
jgi:hypothetical protein